MIDPHAPKNMYYFDWSNAMLREMRVEPLLGEVEPSANRDRSRGRPVSLTGSTAQ